MRIAGSPDPVRNQADLLPDERLRPARLLDEKPKLNPPAARREGNRHHQD